MERIHYDAVIIGSGQAGNPLANALGAAGHKTAIVEREHAGGTCINEGCSPTKTMVASARVAYLARRAADYGVETGPVSVDMVKVRQRKRDIVSSFRAGTERRIASSKGVDLVMGEARFTGPRSIEVRMNDGEVRQLDAQRVFINTGARPAMPSLPGVDQVQTYNSTTLMELGIAPEHLVVIGGGYVGLEFGQMFRRFGSRVTIVQHGPRLLTREDDDVADEVAAILRQDGIDVLLDTNPTRVTQPAPGHIRLTVAGPAGEQVVNGSHLLIAAGRAPNSDRLNLAAAGVAVDEHGFVKVNERLETNVPDIYALGDVKGGPAFTHISYDDYRIIRTNLVEGGKATTTGRIVPYTVFMDPQLGRVGLTESQARKRGGRVRVAKMPMTSVARAVEVAESRGFMKAIVDGDTSQILGCAVLGLEGGEIMAMIQVAMMGKMPYTVLREATFAHPTLSESLNNLFSSFVD